VPQEAAASAAEVRQALDRIWLSFEHTRRVLPTARSAQLRAQALTIHGHVTEYVLALAALPTHPEVAHVAELDHIVELLRDVGARTVELTRELPQRRGPWDDLLPQPPAALAGLVAAVTDLLLAVGRARRALPAGSPGTA
jgi:hypothetical protein